MSRPLPRPSPRPPALRGTGIQRYVVSSLAALLCAPLSAQEGPAAQPLGLSGSVGLGVLSAPRYAGSPNRRTLGAPHLELTYRTAEWGRVELNPQGLAWQVHEAQGFRAGVLLSADPGRKERDVSGVDPTPGDRRLAGLGEVRASPEAGFTLGYGPVGVTYRQALGKRGHQGMQLQVTADASLPLQGAWSGSVGTSLNFANRDYMQAYFGVTPQQSASTAFGTYTAKGGLHQVDLRAGLTYALRPNVNLTSSLTVSRLMGDAKDSPIVSQRCGNAVAHAGVSYLF